MKRLVVLGAGESGVGTAILALQKGYEVFVSDLGRIQDKYKQQLNAVGAEWEEQTHTFSLILNADEVVKSPGIPDKAPVIRALIEKGISVISEIEFACRYTSAKLIGITGSNGKTTTTMLVYQMLCEAGLHVGLGGNIGQSFALQVARFDYDVYVLELSSFQLDGMFQAKLDVAILTNITPDHLDRYNYDFELYVASKMKVVQNQDQHSFFITCLDDKVVQRQIETGNLSTKVNVLYFSTQSVCAAAYVKDAEISISHAQQGLKLPIASLQIKGRHNQYNAMAAALTGFVMNLTSEQISDSLKKFSAVEHRLEAVATVNGVQFINDSKATNVDSTFYALECMPTGTVLIMGGTDKGNVYDDLLEFVHQKIKAIVCLGVDNSKLLEAFGTKTLLHETQSMKDAVQLAYEIANGTGTVLLSPACASFDLFKNYEDRGRQFKAAVQGLIQGKN